MLDPSRAPASPAWRRWVPLIGAAIALAIGGWLTYTGIDYARNRCDCDKPWFPDWSWVVTLALAAVSYALALALIARKLTLRHP